jgi:excisionase family DNA binding protein
MAQERYYSIMTHNILSSQERLAYTLDEAVLLTTLSRATLKRLIGEGRLAAIKVRRRRLVPRASLERLLEEGA